MNAATPVCVTAAHDDYTIWFHVDARVTAPLLRTLEVPACTCLYHVFYSRERIMQLNDAAHTAAYADAIAALLARRPGARLLQADDGVVLATAAAEIGGVTVALPHLSGYARHLHAELFRCELGLPDARNSVASAYARIGFGCRAGSHRTPAFSKTTFDLAPVEGGMPAGGPFDILMAEPYYANFQSALPWRGLVHFWYVAAREIRRLRTDRTANGAGNAMGCAPLEQAPPHAVGCVLAARSSHCPRQGHPVRPAGVAAAPLARTCEV